MSISYALQKLKNWYLNYKCKDRDLLFTAARASNNFGEYKDEVIRLIDRGFDMNIMDNLERSLSMYATSWSNYEMMSLLISKRKICLYHKNQYGDTLLDILIERINTIHIPINIFKIFMEILDYYTEDELQKYHYHDDYDKKNVLQKILYHSPPSI